MRVVYIIVILGMLLGFTEPAFAKHKVHHNNSAPAKAAPRQVAIASAIYGTPELAATLNQIVNSNGNSADVAVYAKSMKYGDTLYTRNINQPLTPASTLKVLTAEAALVYLGPEYRFSTQVLTDAKSIKNGVLQGNLYVVLSGDPSLTYYDLVELMLTLKNQQIQAIGGNVYIDNTAYDQSFYGPGWIWKDKSYCYAAPISASIINHNCLSFQVAPSKVSGRVAEVLTSPKFYYPTIKSNVVTKAQRSRSCSIHLSTDTGGISIEGCMPRGQVSGISYVVTDVPEYNRALFKDLLNRLSVPVYGSVTFGSAPENLSLIGQHASKPLRNLINDMLKKSDNVIAGALFKKLGQLYSHQPGSWENGSLAYHKS